MRLKTSVALFTTAPEPITPVVPKLPTCSVPVVIVVGPAYVFAPTSTVVPEPDCVTPSDPESTGCTTYVPGCWKSTSAAPLPPAIVAACRVPLVRPLDSVSVPDDSGFAPSVIVPDPLPTLTTPLPVSTSDPVPDWPTTSAPRLFHVPPDTVANPVAPDPLPSTEFEPVTAPVPSNTVATSPDTLPRVTSASG